MSLEIARLGVNCPTEMALGFNRSPFPCNDSLEITLRRRVSCIRTDGLAAGEGCSVSLAIQIPSQPETVPGGKARWVIIGHTLKCSEIVWQFSRPETQVGNLSALAGLGGVIPAALPSQLSERGALSGVGHEADSRSASSVARI